MLQILVSVHVDMLTATVAASGVQERFSGAKMKPWFPSVLNMNGLRFVSMT